MQSEGRKGDVNRPIIRRTSNDLKIVYCGRFSSYSTSLENGKIRIVECVKAAIEIVLDISTSKIEIRDETTCTSVSWLWKTDCSTRTPEFFHVDDNRWNWIFNHKLCAKLLLKPLYAMYAYGEFRKCPFDVFRNLHKHESIVRRIMYIIPIS
jgi:hypothetical protein